MTLHNTSHLLAGKREFESTPPIILSIGLKPDEYVLKPIAFSSLVTKVKALSSEKSLYFRVVNDWPF